MPLPPPATPERKPQILHTETGVVVSGLRSGRFVPRAEHPEDCTCGMCDRAPRDCPYPRCWATGDQAPLGIRRLGQHIAWVHKRRRRGFARIVVPGGTSWLTTVLRDPHRAAGLHLEALPRFSRWLLENWQRKPHRVRQATRTRVRAALLHASELAARSPREPFTVPCGPPPVPAALGEAICLLALETNTSVRDICTALLAYGMEALAKELRVSHFAPPVRLPNADA